MEAGMMQPEQVMRLCLLVYVPHMIEEYATGMYDDPLVVLAFTPLAHLAPRQATYLVFQVMMGVALGMSYLVSRGGRGRDLVIGGLALALIGEGHHVLRFAASQGYNPGLVTSLPMPVLGGLLLRALAGRPWPAFAGRE
jgi:hypothetical protein